MFKRLIVDLHRRSLWQVLTIYAAGSWGALEVVGALTDAAGMPDWVPSFALVLLVLGLPIVLATAFVQEGLPGSDARRPDPAPAATPSTASAPAPAPAPATHRRLLTWRNALLGGIAAFALLGVSAAGYMGMRVFGIGAPGTLVAQGVIEAGAAVLLADFDSGSDAELGEVVTGALRVDLHQSQMIRIVEDADLGPALARAQLPDSTHITRDIALEIAEREGYSAVITGDVARAGNGYVLTADILAGDGFRSVAAFRESARSDDDLIDAIEQLSRSIRDKAGESLRQVRNSPPLAQVTTASLPALRSYTHGIEEQRRGNYEAALAAYERAAALDTMFAMAYRKVAVILNSLGMRRTDVVAASRRVYELRDRLPEIEQHHAVAWNHFMLTGDFDAAARAYEEILAIDSLDPVALPNLALTRTYQGRYEEAEALLMRDNGRQPSTGTTATLAGVRYRLHGLPAAMATMDSMHAGRDWSEGYYFQTLFAAADGDVDAADSLAALTEREATSSVDKGNAVYARYVAAASAGRLREAERARTAMDVDAIYDTPLWRAAEVGIVWIHRGDTTAAVRMMQDALAAARTSGPIDDFDMSMHLLLEARAVGPATDLMSEWEELVPEGELGFNARVSREEWKAVLARERGDLDESLAGLRALSKRCPGCGTWIPFELGRTWEAIGQPDSAIAAYEKSLEPDPLRAFYSPFLLARIHQRLGELYDARGDTENAAAHYARFIGLWENADPELRPIVDRARERLEALVASRG